MRLTLKQIQVFLAVAASENMTQAAESLNLSQSAVSSALKELEQAYGLQLFDRHGKRLHLNTTGRLLRQEAERLLAQAAVVEQLLCGKGATGELKLGATRGQYPTDRRCRGALPL